MATIEDIEIPSLLLQEVSAPATPASGFGRLYVKTTGIFFKGDDGVEIGPLAGSTVGLGAWTDYTPTWTADGTAPALGNGTLVGRFKALDANSYQVVICLTAGTTTTFGTGTWHFALPATAKNTTGQQQSFGGYILDSGTDHKLATGVINPNATTVSGIVPEGGNVVTNTVPMTWATTDVLQLQGILEV